jgi:hypothetical protein
MFAEFLSAEQFIHFFPSLFAILLCFLSKLDHFWIDWKLDRELPPTINPALRAATKGVANGAAAMNIHLVNILLFFAGSMLTVFDWPWCLTVWPLVLCVLLFSLILYELVITALPTSFESIDREPIEESRSRWRCLRSFRKMPVGDQLRWQQIAFNLVIILMMVGGLALGGAKNSRGICKVEASPAPVEVHH